MTNTQPESEFVVNYLQEKKGVNVYMVTGDHKETATAIAVKLGIPSDHVFAEITPAGKSAIIARIQQGSADSLEKMERRKEV